MRMSQQELDAILTRRAPSLQTVIAKHGFTGGKVPPKANKFRNKKVEYGGALFDSQGERDRWIYLTTLQQAGKIFGLRRQVSFELLPALVINGKRERATVYNADFVYQENGALVVEDWKSEVSRKLPAYRLKRKMLFHTHGIVIRETSK